MKKNIKETPDKEVIKEERAREFSQKMHSLFIDELAEGILSPTVLIAIIARVLVWVQQKLVGASEWQAALFMSTMFSDIACQVTKKEFNIKDENENGKESENN